MKRGNVFLVFVAGFALIGLSYWGNHQTQTVAAPQETQPQETQTQAQTAMAAQTTTEIDKSTPAESGNGDAQAQGSKVKIISVKGQVACNDMQTVVAHVPPHSTAHIEVDVDGTPFQNAALQDQTADADGQVTWTWKVEGNPDDPVAITISDGGDEADSLFQIEP